jgi:hypothetical protein
MQKALLYISLALLIILIPLSVAEANDGSIPFTGSRWNVEARTFNIVGKPQIYDTVQRSGISVILQNWATESGARALIEINALKGE